MRAGAHEIPVRQDGAGGIPPALGVETCSAGSSSAPAAPSLGSGRNNTNAIRQHSPVSTKVEDSVCNDAADQAGTVVMIGVGGGVSLPFLHFHVAPNDARRSRSQPHKF